MNLKAIQHKYRVFKEPGYSSIDKWGYEIRGRDGMIYPYSETKLGVQVRAGIMANRIRRMKKWPVIQDADDFVVFVADKGDLDFFARYVKARKRLIHSPETLERMKRHGFKPRQNVMDPAKNGT